MNVIKRIWLGLLLVTACLATVHADPPSDDPLHALLVPPEVLAKHREQLGLSEQQLHDIHSLIQPIAQQTQEQQQQLHEAMGRLVELLSAEQVNEQATLDQLDKVLATEKELKRMHLRVMIQIRNQLTPEQRQMAARLQEEPEDDTDREERLQVKLKKVHGAFQAQVAAGQPPLEAVGLMQKFPELMKNGQVREAEALLDHVLALLGGPQAGKQDDRPPGDGPPPHIADRIRQLQQRAQQMQQDGKDLTDIHNLMQQLPKLMQQGKIDEAVKLLDQALELTGKDKDATPAPSSKIEQPELDDQSAISPEAVEQGVAALYQEDVPWRKIDWQACLIDGLRKSREQNKPIMLWVFIDRPIDDERC